MQACKLTFSRRFFLKSLFFCRHNWNCLCVFYVYIVYCAEWNKNRWSEGGLFRGFMLVVTFVFCSLSLYLSCSKELTVKKGDYLEVLNNDKKWWRCRDSNNKVIKKHMYFLLSIFCFIITIKKWKRRQDFVIKVVCVWIMKINKNM